MTACIRPHRFASAIRRNAPQGRHGLFDSDASTQRVIGAHAAAMAARAD
jgi:hypothetical protein